MAGNSKIGLVQACSLRMCSRILPDAMHQAVFVEAFSLGIFAPLRSMCINPFKNHKLAIRYHKSSGFRPVGAIIVL